MNFLIASPKFYEPKTNNKLTHLCLAPEFYLCDQVSTKKIQYDLSVLSHYCINFDYNKNNLVHKYISTEGISTTIQCLAPLCKPPGPQFPAAQTCFG